jgi:hypothetical protein
MAAERGEREVQEERPARMGVPKGPPLATAVLILADGSDGTSTTNLCGTFRDETLTSNYTIIAHTLKQSMSFPEIRRLGYRVLDIDWVVGVATRA